MTTAAHTPPPAVDRPTLTVVKEPLEGTVVEHQGDLVVERRPRPAWMRSAKDLKQHAVYVRDNALDWAGYHAAHSPYYVGWSFRGYGRLACRWIDAYRDDYPQLIKSARETLHGAKGNPAREVEWKQQIIVHRTEYRRHRNVHLLKTGGWATAATAGVGAGAWFGGTLTDIILGLAVLGFGAWHGRPEQPAAVAPQAPRRVSQLGEETMRRVLVEGEAVPEKRAEEIRGVGIPHTEGPGIAYCVDLPSGIPASVAVAKADKIASALGVHKDWMDLAVDRGEGSSESRLKVWVSHEDPFAVVRRSPLVGHKGTVDTWRDGVPVVFGKRGNAINFHVRDVSMLVGGATRRGKGVWLANLLLGIAKDVRVNIRLFDGKGSGEHNPFAPILSTFVKGNPERLALFLRAGLEEMERRADFLDERNLDKVNPEILDEIGGLEVWIVDELATYTPKGTSDFADEITENLSQVAAVALSLGIILVSLTQVPEVDVVRGRLRQNHIGRTAVNTESASASNTIMGDGMAGQGYDASKIPLDQPGRCFTRTPEIGTIPARSFLVEREDKLAAAAEGHELRRRAGRLPGQWHDPIESRLKAWTGVSSAAGGERGNGRITRVTILERLEILAKATGRGSVTNSEIFQALASTDPAKYAMRDGENEKGWTTRVGAALKEDLKSAGVELEVKRVVGADGGRTYGYQLADIIAARNA
ncbi:FtsK/SpoIIIE domain-containing protein [Streptomyces lavendulocolor]|uniref:FtsK/SpoIIIE domain-containing protein n=1 Tax=Streptomyces lavendulocolor TaxID=67316 RepID=UPI0033E696DA